MPLINGISKSGLTTFGTLVSFEISISGFSVIWLTVLAGLLTESLGLIVFAMILGSDCPPNGLETKSIKPCCIPSAPLIIFV